MLYAGVLSSGYRTPMYCTAWTQSLLGLACQPFGKFCMTTLQPHLHSPLSIVTYLAGSPRWLVVYRLSFPLLTRVYQTHARGRRCHSTTWRVGVSPTWTLSCQGTMTLPLIPRSSKTGFERTGRTQRFTAD